MVRRKKKVEFVILRNLILFRSSLKVVSKILFGVLRVVYFVSF